ncbi:MAG: hypothetical protein ACRDPJ_07280 [Nocardioidaceae bacterium]
MQASRTAAKDLAEIEEIVQAFFAAFTSGPGHTDLFGDIAHWFGAYAKAGVQNGSPFAGRGMKSLQFVRTSEGWLISAAAWDDERDGLVIGEG